VDDVDEASAVEAIVAGATAGRGGWVVTPNVDILRKMVRDPELRALAARADLVLPDGMPLVWASRLLGTPLRARVPASALVLPLARASAARGIAMFLLGGEPGVAEAAADALVGHAPGLLVAGCYAPPLGFEHDPAEHDRIVARLAAAQPGVVLCAFGCPKQERLMARLAPRFPSTWFLGVGGTLTMLSGRTPMAPRWVGRLGLEWVHRLAQEPGRLARRYLVDDAPFAIRLLLWSAAARHRARRAGAQP
jgi:N-acetylglucosaminyldiphosphoundecaprenol N-acetyl-beta-D-mannosaminyltransferase